jgi:hypothetical protein
MGVVVMAHYFSVTFFSKSLDVFYATIWPFYSIKSLSLRMQEEKSQGNNLSVTV